MIHRFVVADEAATERLDRYLSTQLGETISRAQIQRLITERHVLVDGAAAKPSFRVGPSMTVSVELPPPAPTELIPEPVPLDVLFEDADLIAVAKPAGMPVHPGAGHRTGTLVHALLAHCRDLSGIGGVERPGIVHRLDKDTSGVLVAAKNDFAHGALAEQFAARKTKKLYRAWVIGRPKEPAGRIQTLIGRHRTQRKRFSTRVSSGKEAVSEYELVREGGGVAELQVKILTGRTHQIRVQLADQGWPIVADALYGGERWNRLTAAAREASRALGRQALHAERLVIAHPRDGRILELVAPWPADLRLFAGAVFP